MRPKDVERARRIDRALVRFAQNEHPLPGLRSEAHRDSFVEQLVESLRRIEYVHLIERKHHGPERADPLNELFDPLRAAVIAKQAGNFEEACWLVFLAIHCGKNLRCGWRLARLLYAGNGNPWTWTRVSTQPGAFRTWLARHEAQLRPDGRYGFGNHRKYETLDPNSARGTGQVIESYVRWVMAHGSHAGLLRNAAQVANGDSGRAFDHLYHSINAVMSFGRMAKFDYLTMLSKLGLAEIEPGIPYMSGATGPVRGARLLFGGNQNREIPTRRLDELTALLGRRLGAGMQAMEDAICNWQKSPGRFRPFRG